MRELRAKAAFWTVLAGLCFGGCVTQTEGERMREDIFSLKTQTETLHAMTTRHMEETRITLQDIRRDLDKLLQTSQVSKASGRVQIDTLREELNRLNGMIEQNGYDLHQTGQKIQKDLDSLRTRISVIEAKAGIEPPGSQQAKTEQAIAAEPVQTLPETPADFYKHAKNLISSRKDIVEGRRLLAMFLKKWPKDKSADNAQYWIGESYFMTKKYDGAVLAFQKVVDNYPKTDSVDDALFMLGECFRMLDLKDNARPFYEEVIAKYPKTRSAEKARKALKKL